MDVVLKACSGKNLATGKVEVHPQHSIWVDETLVGYKAWEHGSNICFIGRFSPDDKKAIEEAVDLILGDGAEGVMPLDRGLYENNEAEEDNSDDFDS